jgi:hypothetical protein
MVERLNYRSVNRVVYSNRREGGKLRGVQKRREGSVKRDRVLPIEMLDLLKECA